MLEKISRDQNLKISKKYASNQDRLDAAVAKHSLDDDLGYFSDSYDFSYDLDDKTRDRLIANARQDAAHALIVSIRNSRDLRLVQKLMLLVIAGVAYLIFR